MIEMKDPQFRNYNKEKDTLFQADAQEKMLEMLFLIWSALTNHKDKTF